MRSFWRSKKAIFIILFLAIFFRFNNLNWDNNHHLHPDERFLTMVGNATKIPKNIFDYFNPQVSTLNPNNVGYNFFIYGTLPLTLNKILAVIFNTDNYNDFTIQGRFLSGIADLLIIILVYETTKLLLSHCHSEPKAKNLEILRYTQDDKIALFAAFFYAIAVLPIQLSHFFAVDTFLNLFMFTSFYFSLKFNFHKKKLDTILSAIFFGLALACKITAIFILPLIVLIIVLGFVKKKGLDYKKVFICLFFFGLVSYFLLRLTDPNIFSNSNFFDPRPNKIFVENLKSLKTFDNKDIWYPPGVQWINKPALTFALVNLIIFGVGIPYAVFVLMGIISNIKDQPRLNRGQFRLNRNQISKKIQSSKFKILNFILVWVLGFFLYQSTQYVKSIRYFIFLYPFLAIFAGIGINVILSGAKNLSTRLRNKRSFVVLLLRMTPVLLFIIILIWPLMFSSIYLTKNSRVEASEWIYKNLPNQSIILGELWDDPLPLYVQNNLGKQFLIEQLPVFDPDTSEKWQKMDVSLNRADYYVLSSNRGWGSIPTVPEKYPQMSKFYDNLLANKTNYKIIKEFTSYPSLRWLGIPLDFPDQWSEEAFTVYDHPKVIILKNTVN